MVQNPIVIAGPCSAESDEQMEIAITEGSKRKVDFLRTNLWKPRDEPNFDGLGEKGFHLLKRVAEAGINPGLEVMTPENVTSVMEATLPHLKPGGKLLVWIGARNQNHFIQREIGRVAAGDARVWLMVKNQPWPNDLHWGGILKHVLAAGFPQERLLNCYRGVAPSAADDNPLGLRNLVDFDNAMEMKSNTSVPMIFDPSHTGGSVENVLKIGEAAAAYNFDGLIVEVHHDPTHALTDAKQQLTWPQFDELMEKMKAAVKA
jgi:3-deoxy-D-arabino-heptulosonate 7-phosphate (DAHP) synthase